MIWKVGGRVRVVATIGTLITRLDVYAAMHYMFYPVFKLMLFLLRKFPNLDSRRYFDNPLEIDSGWGILPL
jgi:hypothetical protein